MICVTTRFRLKHVWSIIAMYLIYWRMRPDLARVPGLIRYAFLLQSPLTCCTLSIWESEVAVTDFSNTASHIHAVRFAKRWCRDIWSAYWRIEAVSTYASQWRGAGESQGHWPLLVPHHAHPWRLVPPSTGVLPEVARHAHREP